MALRYLRPITALSALMAARLAPPAACREMGDPPSANRLEILVDSSDEYAEAVLTAEVPKGFRLGAQDHARITSILDTTKQLIDTARMLVQDDRTLDEGRAMLDRASGMFRDLKQHLIAQREMQQAVFGSDEDGQKAFLRKGFSDHDLQMKEEDEKRALDAARKIYETMVTFPECVERFLDDCLNTINDDLPDLGLSTIEVVVHEKRNSDQAGYNKVVIVTNELADRVRGRAGDGLVSYPFLWDEALTGVARTLGVDGRWNCQDMTPDQCCDHVKQGVGQNVRGEDLECHIFVPFGGVGNPRRNDRVFVNLSPDGRIHEAPVIQ